MWSAERNQPEEMWTARVYTLWRGAERTQVTPVSTLGSVVTFPPVRGRVWCDRYVHESYEICNIHLLGMTSLQSSVALHRYRCTWVFQTMFGSLCSCMPTLLILNEQTWLEERHGWIRQKTPLGMLAQLYTYTGSKISVFLESWDLWFEEPKRFITKVKVIPTSL